ncbi:hypothetical protein O181_106458 [Austropuccinia psidii MF-1]|uniref:Uncharacterized protein n=1 Tax=Austropuccinia psidii MF-1 TaxID=1389203 RepID=A0A9Q3JQS8_9BASI|nr:hypothetical protein [Austropuccinia psidii MF-1]
MPQKDNMTTQHLFLLISLGSTHFTNSFPLKFFGFISEGNHQHLFTRLKLTLLQINWRYMDEAIDTTVFLNLKYKENSPYVNDERKAFC